jgi:hypothetical protein
MAQRTRVGLRAAAKEVAQRAASVARLQAELARSEMRGTALLGAGAAVFAIVGFMLLTCLFVVALAVPLPAWLATLIVTVVYFAVAAALGVAFRQARQGAVARDQARITAAAVRRARGDGAAESTLAPPGAVTNAAAPVPAAIPGSGGSHGDGA